MRHWFVVVAGLFCLPADAVDWRPSGPWSGSDLVLKLVDPDAQRVYATGREGLFRSDDRGLSWVALPPPPGRRDRPEGAQFAQSPVDPDRLLAVFDQRYAYRSDDGGDTWKLLLDARIPGSAGREAFTAVAIDPQQPQRLSVFLGQRSPSSRAPETGALAGWYSSDDGGVSFVYRPLEPLGLAKRCAYDSLSVEAAEYLETGRVHASLAARCGSFFEYDLQEMSRTEIRLLSTIGVQMLDAEEVPASQLIALEDAVLWRVNDLLTRLGPSGMVPTALSDGIEAVHVDAEGGLWAATGVGLRHSADNGQTWDEVDTGAIDSEIAPHTMARFSDGRLLLFTSDTVLTPNSSSRTPSTLTAGRH